LGPESGKEIEGLPLRPNSYLYISILTTPFQRWPVYPGHSSY